MLMATIRGGRSSKSRFPKAIIGGHFSPSLISGADQIMMPAAIADAFGIDRSACPKRTSLGVSMEPIDGFVSNLTFRIERQAEEFEAPVIFIDTDVPVLLGREGFFDLYCIKFEQDHDTFEISPAPIK